MSAHSCNAACQYSKELHDLQKEEDLLSLEQLDDYLTDKASQYLTWSYQVRGMLQEQD